MTSARKVLQDQAEALEEEVSSAWSVRVNGWKVVIVAIVAGLAVATLFFLRASQTSSADKRICGKVDRLTSALINYVQKLPPPSDPELLRERLSFLTAMRHAACDPANLPSAPK